MKSAVFLDLDGTLWEAEAIPASALEAIQKAQNAGHLVFANTGRARSTGQPPLEKIGLDGGVYSAGTEIVLDGRRLFFRPLGLEAAAAIRERLDTLDIGYAAEGSHQTFANEKDKAYLRDHIGANRVSSVFLELPDPSTMNDKDLAQIMKFSIQMPDLTPIADLMERYDLEFTPFAITMDGMMTGELTRRELTKATALETVRSLLDEPIRTVAIGDSENDIPMLSAADLSIAMGNGTRRAKEAADWVTSDINDNGLYNAFEHAGLFEQA